MKKKVINPSNEPNKTDLFAIIANFSDYSSSHKSQLVLHAEAAETIAEEAFEEFCKSNKDYIKLRAAVKKAKQQTKDARENTAELRQRIQNLLHREGASPRVLKLIDQLIGE